MRKIREETIRIRRSTCMQKSAQPLPAAPSQEKIRKTKKKFLLSVTVPAAAVLTESLLSLLLYVGIRALPDICQIVALFYNLRLG